MNYVVIIGVIMAICFSIFIAIYIAYGKGSRPKPTPFKNNVSFDDEVYLKIYTYDSKGKKYIFQAFVNPTVLECGTCIGVGTKSIGGTLGIKDPKNSALQGRNLTYGTKFNFMMLGNIVGEIYCSEVAYRVGFPTDSSAIMEFIAEPTNGLKPGDPIKFNDIFSLVVITTFTTHITFSPHSPFDTDKGEMLMETDETRTSPYYFSFVRELS